MPTTYLWAINTQGKIYSLASNGHQWEELNYFGIDFKRISSVQRCLWAIGGDHQLYLYILGSEVAIRYKEVTYENQRWNPKDGYSHHLLPTDRPQWSSQDGLINRPKEKIKLPTLGWQWDGDWQIEDNLDGQPLGHEGWMYAFDFPMTYGKDKKINSFVRRRKWVRYRTYVAVDKWSSIPGIHADPLLEPFIDIAVGGLDIPGADGDTLACWSVTVQGRVMFRYGVTHNKPEGDGWIHIRTLQEKEVNHISVGPMGLVWAVTWDGKALVRTGVTRYKITGTSWSVVEPPAEDCPLLQVSVGTDVVWAISRNGRIWLRKGIRGFESGENDECAVGSGWVEMVGELSLISVGPDDQVWALSKDDPNKLFFRMGISSKEPGGKMWRPIQLPALSRSRPVDRIVNRSNIALNEMVQHASNTSLSSSESNIEMKQSLTIFKNDHSSKQSIPDSIAPEFGKKDSDAEIHACGDSLAIDTDKVNKRKHEKSVFYFPAKDSEIENSSPSSDKLSIRSLHSETGMIDNDSSDGSPKPTKSGHSSQASLAYFDDEFLEETRNDFFWSWISGSSCVIDPDQLSNWFVSGNSLEVSQMNEPWRKDIIDKLGKRYEREVQPFDNYEYAIDRASWTKQGKCLINSNRQWSKCRLELEQIPDKDQDLGAFIGFYYQGNVEKIDIKDITCVMTMINQNQTVLSIYTAERTLKHTPVCLSFTTAKELEDWIAILNTTCCDFQGIKGTPKENSFWAISGRGDVFVHSLLSDDENLPQPHKMFWRQLGGHLSIVESSSAGVVWGIGYNHVPWVYTGGWGGGLFQGLATSRFGIYPMTDVRRIYVYENQRWNPLTGFTARGLPTDRYMWSDSTGHYECTKENMSVPSIHWHWISNWMIDYQKLGGVDKEGWQYAKDFPRAYHSYKGIADYVRRRRWYRKCRLNTSGPWKELESVQLIDLSFQVDPINSADTLISTWAIDIHGNVLYRHKVSKNCPQGSLWEHVAADQGFISISVGGKLRIWAIAKDGSAYMRNGVTEHIPTGTAWFHVEPPSKGLLRQISAGDTSVWAVDNSNQLWFRQEIMQMFPEGTCWKYVCDNIRRVSVGQNDEVWAITDTVDTPTGEVYGMISHRVGVTAEDKIGTGWEHGTGSGWSYISARAVSPFVLPET